MNQTLIDQKITEALQHENGSKAIVDLVLGMYLEGIDKVTKDEEQQKALENNVRDLIFTGFLFGAQAITQIIAQETTLSGQVNLKKLSERIISLCPKRIKTNTNNVIKLVPDKKDG